MKSIKEYLTESFNNVCEAVVVYDKLTPLQSNEYHPIYITKVTVSSGSITIGQPPKNYFNIDKMSEIVGHKLPGGYSEKFSQYVSKYLDSIGMDNWLDFFKKTILPQYTIKYWNKDIWADDVLDDDYINPYDHDYEKSPLIDDEGCETMRYAIYKGSKLVAYLKIGGS